MVCVKRHYFNIAKSLKEKYMKHLVHQHDNQKNVPTSWNNAKPYDEIPGPKPIPLLGNFWRFLPLVGNYYGLYAHQQYQKFHDEFGNIMRLTSLCFRDDIVFVYDPVDFETVFRNDSPWPIRIGLESLKYYRLKTRNNIFQGCGGTATSHGEEWYNIRSTVNGPLMGLESVKQYIPVVNEVASDFIDKIDYLLELSPNKNELPDNFNVEVFKWAFESIAAITLNSRLGTLSRNFDKGSEGQKMIDATFELFPLMYKLDMLPSLWKIYSTKNWKKYVEQFDVITNTCVNYINKSIKKIENGPFEDNKTPSLLEILIRKDKRIAVAMSVDLLLGGTETTSETVASCLYYLATNKDAQSKLREEIMRLVPDKRMFIDKTILDQCQYLKAVLKETMRLAPVAIATLRAAGKDMVLSGYRIPKGVRTFEGKSHYSPLFRNILKTGSLICEDFFYVNSKTKQKRTNVINGHMILCHSDKYFPQAKRFIPERWIRNGKDNPFMYKNSNPFVSLPFGFGPRSCIGRRLSEIEMEVLFLKVILKYKIIRNYEIEWKNGEMEWQGTIVYGIKSPLKLHVKRLN